MSEFNLEEALAGKPVKLRNGEKAIVAYNMNDVYESLGVARKFEHPLHVVKEGGPINLTEKGKVLYDGSEHDCDIVGMWEEPHPLKNMPIGHPIYVRDSDRFKWCMREFVGLTKDGKVSTASDSHWNQWKLVPKSILDDKYIDMEN